MIAGIRTGGLEGLVTKGPVPLKNQRLPNEARSAWNAVSMAASAPRSQANEMERTELILPSPPRQISPGSASIHIHDDGGRLFWISMS